MKKLFLFLTSVCLLASCSSDDSASASFTSTLKIDNVSFTPTAAIQYQPQALAQYTSHSFTLSRGDESFGFNINTPVGLDKSGSYSLGIVTMGERYSSAGYNDGENSYGVVGDAIEIEAKGGNIYKVTFVNTQLKDINNPNNTKTFTGSFEGEFSMIEN